MEFWPAVGAVAAVVVPMGLLIVTMINKRIDDTRQENRDTRQENRDAHAAIGNRLDNLASAIETRSTRTDTELSAITRELAFLSGRQRERDHRNAD